MISTRGFGIDVMPQVYQAAPENLSVNPNLITKGMLDAFEVNDKLARLNAFKLQQQEINANRAARIDEERARLGYSSLSHDANASLVADKTNLERLRLLSDIFNQPKESALKSQGLDYLLLKTAGAIAQQPHLNAAGLIDAQGLAERAGTENSLKGLELADKFTQFGGDSAQRRALVSAQINKDMAAAELARAQAADVADRARRADEANATKVTVAEKNAAARKAITESADAKRKLLNAEAQQIRLNLEKFAKPNYTAPEVGKAKVSLPEIYDAAVKAGYAPDGEKILVKPASSGFFGIGKSPEQAINPTTAGALRDQAQMMIRLRQIEQLKAKLDLDEAKQAAALLGADESITSPSEDDLAALNFVKDPSNKNHPRYGIILAELKSRGIIQ